MANSKYYVNYQRQYQRFAIQLSLFLFIRQLCMDRWITLGLVRYGFGVGLAGQLGVRCQVLGVRCRPGQVLGVRCRGLARCQVLGVEAWLARCQVLGVRCQVQRPGQVQGVRCQVLDVRCQVLLYHLLAQQPASSGLGMQTLDYRYSIILITWLTGMYCYL